MGQILGFLLIGLGAGVLSGFFGIGGGIVIVPLLMFFWNFAPTAATGTSLVALLLPVGILGVLEYYKAGKIGTFEIKTGLIIACGIFIGALIGSKIALRLDPMLLRRCFAVLIVAMAVRLWFMK